MIWLCLGSTGEFALNHVLPMCLPTGTAMAFGFAMRIVLAGAATSLGIYIIEDLFILLSVRGPLPSCHVDMY